MFCQMLESSACVVSEVEKVEQLSAEKALKDRLMKKFIKVGIKRTPTAEPQIIFVPFVQVDPDYFGTLEEEFVEENSDSLEKSQVLKEFVSLTLNPQPSCSGVYI